MDRIESFWHLARDEAQAEVANFELQLWRVFHGFMRWQEECEKSVNGTGLNGHELAVLHVVRMKDKPKSISDIGRILNRKDDYNINYILRKLQKMDLIKKMRVKGSKLGVYEITPKGIKNTDTFSDMKRRILVKGFSKAGLTLETLAENLIKIRAIYDEADSTVVYTGFEEGSPPLEKVAIKSTQKNKASKIKKAK